ncbi:MAG TPA: CHAT domain-containing protein [Oscillatoriales cyanobacterium M59_W2019_021]|nr:MAG: CHAT domain-containing protein [Cyanobacteria bacterium J055]HIK32092.1 CHAT domain-containing protein [Oscillatoriales cyanobacterium M4454_W2019_049]HIK51293.1 CHAT domain-containing protein [Oscillatoriales cyanobacterium M59_W2019_021]
MRDRKFKVIKLRKWLKWAVLGLLGLLLAIAVPPAMAVLIPEAPQPETPISNTPTAAANPMATGRDRFQAGRFAEAVADWQAAVQLYDRNGDRANQALSLSYLSLAYQELSQWEEAQEAIDRSRSILESMPDAQAILWGQTLNTQGKLFLATGQAQAALDTWEEAQTFYDRAEDEIGSVGSRINQAQALQTLGFYRRSRDLLTDIDSSLSAKPDSELKAIALRNLGTTLQAIGDLEQSQAALERSLAIAQNLGAKAETSAILLSLGNTAIDLDKSDAALNYFQQAQQAATNPLDALEAQLNQLYIHVESQQWQNARAIAPQIQTQLASLPPSRTTVFGTVNFANSLLKMQSEGQSTNTRDLNRLLADAVRSAQTLKDEEAEAYALSKWGVLYAQNGQINEAIDLEQKSLAVAQKLQSPDIAAQSALELGRLQVKQGKRQPAIAAYTEAVNALQSMRGDLVAINPEVQFTFRESIEPVYRELVELLLEDNPTQDNLIQARDSIENLQLAELDNFFREACLNAEPTPIDRVDPTAAVIYPIILHDRLATIVSVPGQPLSYHSVFLSQGEIENTIGEFLSSLSPVYDSAERLNLGRTLYDWMVKPATANPAFANVKTLVFVLDGKLRQIPMTALYDGDRYLVERYNVALSPGLQLLQSKKADREQLTTVIGGLSEARQGFSALPGVEVEVGHITDELPAAVLLNQQFTDTAFAQKMNEKATDIVHLATHGQFSSKAEDTFLLTWDDRINIKKLDSLLQSRQITKAGSLDLLVLSACETAAGDDRALLGLAGFAVRSGAQSTLATLWRVRDESTVFFITEFYKHLKEPNTSKAEAMRKAQLEMIADANFNDPFFWAPFVLVGNWL